MHKFFKFLLISSFALLGACKGEENSDSEVTRFRGSAEARTERDRLKAEIAAEVQRQHSQVLEAFANVNIQNLPVVWNLYLEKTKTVVESTEKWRETNRSYPQICEPGPTSFA